MLQCPFTVASGSCEQEAHNESQQKNPARGQKRNQHLNHEERYNSAKLQSTGPGLCPEWTITVAGQRRESHPDFRRMKVDSKRT